MAAHYKSVIAANIARKALKGSLDARGFKPEVMEKEIARLIRVLPTNKDQDLVPQLAIKLSDLSNQLKDSLNAQKSHGIQDISSVVKCDSSLQFTVDPEQFSERVLKAVLHYGPEYGYAESKTMQQCVCVDFSSPNIAKPFHVGHIRSTILGNVVCNMYEAVGHDVKRINFLGDWGTQFGLLTLGLNRYGDSELLKTSPMKQFYEVYVKINNDIKKENRQDNHTGIPDSQTYKEAMDLFSKLEKGDKDLTSKWQEIKAVSVADLEKMYQRLGIKFTHTMPESYFVINDKTGDVLKTLKNKNLLEFDTDGVGFVSLDNIQGQLGNHSGKASIVKSDGSSLYLTRDIAAALYRQDKFGCDVMHYVVEGGQQLHFEKLFGVLKKMGIPWADRPAEDIHLKFGRVQGMSTRQGSAVLLGDLLDEAVAKTAEVMKSTHTTKASDTNFDKIAEDLALSAIIFQDLKLDRVKDYKFDWKRMLSFKGNNSGVSAQYSHARLSNMVKNCGVAFTEDVDLASIGEEVTLHRLLLHLARYPDVFENALFTKKPHHIVQYLQLLCHLVNLAYKVCPVKNQPTDVAQARLAVFVAARQVMRNCFTLLGIKPMDEI